MIVEMESHIINGYFQPDFYSMGYDFHLGSESRSSGTSGSTDGPKSPEYPQAGVRYTETNTVDSADAILKDYYLEGFANEDLNDLLDKNIGNDAPCPTLEDLDVEDLIFNSNGNVVNNKEEDCKETQQLLMPSLIDSEVSETPVYSGHDFTNNRTNHNLKNRKTKALSVQGELSRTPNVRGSWSRSCKDKRVDYCISDDEIENNTELKKQKTRVKSIKSTAMDPDKTAAWRILIRAKKKKALVIGQFVR